jgi:hypothetical protein
LIENANSASDPSPVPLRLVKAPEQDTLSRGERVVHSLLIENTILSLGERVDRDGAFFSRRGTGEGLVPAL